MRSQKTKKIFMYDFSITIIIMFVVFYLRRIFIIKMGVETTGLMQLMLQLISYLSISEMGLATASTFALYKPLAKKDNKKLSEIIVAIKSNYCRIYKMIIIFSMMMFPFLITIIKTDIILWKLFLYWSLYVLNTVIGYKYAHIVILLTADQKYYKVKLMQGIVKVSFVLTQIFIISCYKSFLFFILVEVIGNLILYIIFKRIFSKEYNLDLKVKSSIKLFKDMVFVFFHQLSGLIVFNTDYIVLSKFLSLTSVTIYSNYMQIINALNVFISVLSNALSSGIGNYLVTQKKVEKEKLFKEIFSFFSFIAIVISIIFYYSADLFVKLWIGKSFIISEKALILISFNLFVLIFRKPIDVFKNASGFFKDIYIPLIEASLNLIFSIYFVIKLGLIGVILGTSISNLVIVFIRPIITIQHIFNRSMFFYIDLLIKEIIKYLMIIGIFLLLNKNVLSQIKILRAESVIEFLLTLFFVSSLIFILSILVFFVDKNFRSIVSRILNLIVKRKDRIN